MSSKLDGPRCTPVSQGARRSPEVGQKLKSERVQLDFQLVPSQQELLRSLAQRGRFALVGATVTLDLEEAAPAAASGDKSANGASVEAGSAFGTPSHIDQPSTHGKEEDHADSQDLR